MNDAPVRVTPPGSGNDVGEEQARNEKEFRHSEGCGETDRVVKKPNLPGVFACVIRCIHHDNQDDADPFGCIDPWHALRVSIRAPSVNVLSPKLPPISFPP